MENHQSHIDVWKTKPVLIEGASKRLLKGNSISYNESCARSLTTGHSSPNRDFLSAVIRTAHLSNAEA